MKSSLFGAKLTGLTNDILVTTGRFIATSLTLLAWCAENGGGKKIGIELVLEILMLSPLTNLSQGLKRRHY